MQFDYGTINPTTKTGTQLASDLNNFRSAVNSCHKGAVAPAYATTGMMWLDDASNPIWIMKVYDGTEWIPAFQINSSSNQSTPYISGNPATAYGTAAARDTGTAPDQVSLNSQLGALAKLNSVQSAHIDSGAVTSAHLQTSAVTSAALAPNAVGTNKLVNDAVTLDKMAHYQPGGMVIYDAAGSPMVLGPSSEGAQLVMKSGLPTWDPDGSKTFAPGPNVQFWFAGYSKSWYEMYYGSPTNSNGQPITLPNYAPYPLNYIRPDYGDANRYNHSAYSNYSFLPCYAVLMPRKGGIRVSYSVFGQNYHPIYDSYFPLGGYVQIRINEVVVASNEIRNNNPNPSVTLDITGFSQGDKFEIGLKPVNHNGQPTLTTGFGAYYNTRLKDVKLMASQLVDSFQPIRLYDY